MKSERYYVECCGRAKAAPAFPGSSSPLVLTYKQDRHSGVPCGPLAPWIGRCSACRAAARIVTVKVTVRWNKAEAPKCGGKCINGKLSCDCQCNGRCHGAKECLCAA